MSSQLVDKIFSVSLLVGLKCAENIDAGICKIIVCLFCLLLPFKTCLVILSFLHLFLFFEVGAFWSLFDKTVERRQANWEKDQGETHKPGAPSLALQCRDFLIIFFSFFYV